MLSEVRGYRIRQGVITLDSGAKTHKLFKVPVAELAAWDASHDAHGNDLHDTASSDRDIQFGGNIIDKA
jgi:hypothetical protein